MSVVKEALKGREQKTIINNALKEVNKFRKIAGLVELKVLPKGRIGAQFGCPIANALGFRVSVPEFKAKNLMVEGLLKKAFGAETFHGSTYVKTPQGIAAFVEAFDGGQFPELVASKRKIKK